MLRVPADSSKGCKERIVGLTRAVHTRLMALVKLKGRGVPLMPRLHRRSFETARITIDYHEPITLRDLRHCECPLQRPPSPLRGPATRQPLRVHWDTLA